MWKVVISGALLLVILLLGAVGTADAGGKVRGGHGFRGHGGVVLHRPFFSHNRFFIHDKFRHLPGFRTRVFVGTGFFWGPWWGPAYPSYVAPPVVVQEAPPAYVQQPPVEQPPAYWYYCPNPPGYYPYVTECPAGWLTVVPSTTQPPAASPQPSPAQPGY